MYAFTLVFDSVLGDSMAAAERASTKMDKISLDYIKQFKALGLEMCTLTDWFRLLCTHMGKHQTEREPDL